MKNLYFLLVMLFGMNAYCQKDYSFNSFELNNNEYNTLSIKTTMNDTTYLKTIEIEELGSRANKIHMKNTIYWGDDIKCKLYLHPGKYLVKTTIIGTNKSVKTENRYIYIENKNNG